MDAKSHKDNMEKFFHEKWDDQQMSQELGVPDLDDMWGNIKDQSKPEKKRRRLFWWFLPALFLPLALFLVYSDHDSDSVTEAEKNSIADRVQTTFLSSDATVTNNNASLANNAQTYDRKSQENYSGGGTNEPYSSENDSSPEGLSDGSHKVDKISVDKLSTTYKNDGGPFDVESSHLSKATEESMGGIVEDMNYSRTSVEELNSLQSLMSQGLVHKGGFSLIEDQKIPQLDFIPKTYSKYSLAFSATSGRHLYTRESGSQNINGIDVSLEDGSFWRAGLELGIEYRPDKIIKAGLSGKRHTFKSHYELMVNYSGNSEIQDGEGNWHSGYNHSLPTLFGDSPMSHILIRGENDDLQEGEAIPFALFLDHEVDEIALTLTHEWKVPFRKIDFAFGASGQLGYWYAASKIASVNLFSHHDKVWHNQTSYEVDDYKIAQPFNISLGANIGVSYAIKDRHALGVHTGMYQTVLGPKLYGDVVWTPTLIEGGFSYTMSF